MAPKRVGILVGGGPAPGTNGVISAIAIEAIKRDAILLQINSSRVKEWDDHNGSLEFDVGPGPLALTKSRIPVEGEFEDVDGITIHVLLHVVDGRVKDLEVYKDDSSPIVKMPGAEQVRLFRPEDPWPKP